MEIFKKASIDYLPPASQGELSATPVRARLVAIEEDGSLRVLTSSGAEALCDWLETTANGAVALAAGDTLLVLPATQYGRGIALGRIATYKAPEPPQTLVIEASEVLTLKCGDVAVDLRAKDGKLMLRGEDVLLRAKRTQRIKAGSVNIN